MRRALLIAGMAVAADLAGRRPGRWWAGVRAGYGLRTSNLVVLGTGSLQVRDRVRLPGFYAVDAISPTGEDGARRTEEGATVVERTRDAFLRIGSSVDEVRAQSAGVPVQGRVLGSGLS
jgi:hypothetical protein